MVEVVKCKNNHFYDRNAFKECPHCKSGGLRMDDVSEYRKEVSRLAQDYLEMAIEQKPEKSSAVYTSPEQIPVNTEPEPKSTQISRPDSILLSGDNEKTVSFSAGSRGNYLVAGWLVCVEGPDMGYSYNLYYGYNTIGCDSTNRICLNRNSGAAESVHGSIVYENRKNKFYLVPEKEKTIYLNNICHTEIQELTSGNSIRIGKDQFEFIAFCKGNRKWDKKESAE